MAQGNVQTLSQRGKPLFSPLPLTPPAALCAATGHGLMRHIGTATSARRDLPDRAAAAGVVKEAAG